MDAVGGHKRNRQVDERVKIAITGGSGFIGEAAKRYAEACGHEVLSFDRFDGNDVLGSLDMLTDFGTESVIHLAGMLGTHELFDTPGLAIDVNVRGTLRILQWCAANNAGYVGISMPPVFESVYTATKLAADRLATAWHREYGVPVSRVVAFNAFGPGQKHGAGHPQKIIPTFAAHAWAGKPIPIWGDGEQTVDLIHVDQVGRMLIDATKYGDGETFDAGTGAAYTVNQIAAHILDMTQSGSGVEHLPMRRGEVPTTIRASGKGWDMLGWEPRFSFGDLSATVDSYKGVAP